MLVPAALLFALAASARPARLVERQDDRSPMDVGFQFKNDGRCILPKGTIGEGEPIVAEDCTGSTFSGWNLDGAAVGNAHQLRVANTNLCVAAGTDYTQWVPGLRLTLQECNGATNTETWKNTQVWRKDVVNELGAYRLMDQQWLSPYDYYPSEWCMDVEEGWNPDPDDSWALQIWRCGDNPNQNQVFTDDWEAGPNA